MYGNDVRVVAPRRLVVGLGNPCAGDDGVGCRVAECLALDGRLPRDVDVVCGGTDVLRLAPMLADERDVLLVDACLGVAPGELELVEHVALAASSTARSHAHHLSAVEAVDLLVALGELRASRVRWALIGVDAVHAGALSDCLAGSLPSLVDDVLAALRVQHA